MKIEWASHFHPDGRRRTPPPSTMHGWLAKMRGTLIGNEDLRSKGMREMKAAKAERKRQAAKKKQYSAHSGGSLFSFLGLGKAKKPSPQSQKLQSRRRPGGGSTRPSYQSSRSLGSRPARPPLRPSGTSAKSSHRSHRQGSSRSQPHSYSSARPRHSSRR
ncbi:hypothetical protein CVT26_010694 [Gymnopilus dilepis]|uniref:Uncharacterized protein n=1 Tax=Gymnopilus dilepis TaxID=231916 RepID=A0A409VI13_9AGAR|nr:hypothetical protein CVT26_010694 [Gymnopilus dilepis]